jgi:hypothetical protein
MVTMMMMMVDNGGGGAAAAIFSSTNQYPHLRDMLDAQSLQPKLSTLKSKCNVIKRMQNISKNVALRQMYTRNNVSKSFFGLSSNTPLTHTCPLRLRI